MFGLTSVGFKKDIGFKPNQEVLIYHNGIMLESYPGQLGQVKKIKIVKEKSDREISKEALWYCYSSEDNVNITVSELTNKGISLIITDTNEVPYEYAHSYTITKKVKNPNYTGIGYKIGEDTQNSTAGYTGTGLEYIWKEVDKISNISSEETEEELIYNMPNMNENDHISINCRRFNWTNLYGELGERRI